MAVKPVTGFLVGSEFYNTREEAEYWEAREGLQDLLVSKGVEPLPFIQFVEENANEIATFIEKHKAADVPSGRKSTRASRKSNRSEAHSTDNGSGETGTEAVQQQSSGGSGSMPNVGRRKRAKTV